MCYFREQAPPQAWLVRLCKLQQSFIDPHQMFSRTFSMQSAKAVCLLISLSCTNPASCQLAAKRDVHIQLTQGVSLHIFSTNMTWHHTASAFAKFKMLRPFRLHNIRTEQHPNKNGVDIKCTRTEEDYSKSTYVAATTNVADRLQGCKPS